ncbi:MAG: hypothetical protein V4504_00260 [Patescibacteria group bacterium]
MEKIKYFLQSEKGKDLLIILIIILVGLASFMLGRLSKQAQNSDFKVIYPEEQANAISGLNSAKNSQNQQISVPKVSAINDENISIPQGNFFASKRGKKYYPLGCSAGKTIKDTNKVWFATGEDASKAGFELSSSCH